MRFTRMPQILQFFLCFNINTVIDAEFSVIAKMVASKSRDSSLVNRLALAVSKMIHTNREFYNISR